MQNISPELLNAYQEEITKRSSSATLKRKTVSLSKFFNWAEKEGHIEENPISQIKPVSDRKPILAFISLALGIIAIVLALKNVKLPIPSKESSAQKETITQVTSEVQTPPILSASPWTIFAKLSLSDSSGSPVTTSQTITFKLYKSPSDTTPVWTSSPIQQTPDTDGNVMISLDGVPSDVFFQNDRLFLSGTSSDINGNSQTLPSMPVSTANTPIIPFISPTDGSLLLTSESPAIKAKEGNLNIEGQTVTITTPVGSNGNITIAPSGETNILSNLKIQNANLKSGGSLISGYAGNNLSNYDLLNLSSGSKPTEKFSVDAQGNTYVSGQLTVNGEQLTAKNLTVNTIAANGTITDIKKGTALSDLVTLTLDERGKPASSNSIYSTLVLKRYDGAVEGAALYVDEGNAIFDGQIQIARLAADPTAIGQGVIYYNTADKTVYAWNGTAWFPLGGNLLAGYWQRNSGTISPIVATDNLGLDGKIVFSSDTNFYRSAADTLKTDDSLLVSGNVGIGSTSPTAKLTINGTTEQMRLSYTDGTVYSSFTVDSGGDLTIAPTGGDVAVTGDLAVNGATSADILSTTTTGTIFNTTVTTLSLGGAATTLNLGTTDSVTRIINLGTGTGADTINIGTGGTGADAITIGGGVGTLAINTGDWDISTTGVLTGISGITTNGGYTQSGTDANTFTGTSTFSNATYSALFTGGNVGIGTTGPDSPLDILSTGGTQLRLTYTDSSVYSTFNTDSSGNLNITTTGTTTTLSGTTALTLGGNATLYGGSAASGTLTLDSTSNATKGNIQFFSSSNTIDSSGNLTLAGNATVNGNTTLGNATSDTVTFTARVSSNIDPSTGSSYDLGSSARHWLNIYADTGNFTNISGTVTGGSTTSQDWLINSDNATADTEDATLTFERGSPATNAQFKWDSTNKYISINSPSFVIEPDSGITASGKAALIVNQIQNQDIFTASASGTPKFVITNAGNVGIGTTGPTSLLHVLGSQPAAVATTPGTVATSVLNITGGIGGNTTIATTGVGGIGAALSLTGGAGGTAASAVTASTGGVGGAFTFTGGAGGAAAAVGTGTNIGGIGGNITINPGAGGAASGGAVNTAGASGNVLLATIAGSVGIGTAGPDAKLDSLATTEQLRLTYTDGSVYSSHTVDSSGNLNIDVTGTKVDLVDDLEISGNDILDSGGASAVTFDGSQNTQINGNLTVAANKNVTTTSGTGSLVLNSSLSNASDQVVDILPAFAGGATDLLTYTVFDIAAFSPTNAAGADTVNAVEIGALTDPGATITSTALKIGSGWDNVLTVGGTVVINSTGQVPTTQLTGTLVSTSADSGTSTLIQGDTLAVNGGTNGVDTVLSGDTFTLNLDTTEIGTTTFGTGSGITWTFDAGAVDPTIAFASDLITLTAATTALSGDLKLTGADILDTNGNEFLRFTSVASAVNEITIANAATTNGVTLAATGGDAAVALSIDAKGTGALNLNNTGTGDILIGGGGSSTGCTITNATGNLACAGDLTVTGNGITFGNGETIDNDTDGTILLTATTAKTSGNLYVGTSGTGTITSGLINGQTISSAANFTGTMAIATSATVPLVIGGTATTSDLSLQTTSGVGTTGADMHFLVGNNGTTEAMTILNSGNVGIGTTSPGAGLHVIKTTEQLRLGYDASNYLQSVVDATGNTTFTVNGTDPVLKFITAGTSANYHSTQFITNATSVSVQVAGFLAPNLQTHASQGAYFGVGQALSTNNTGTIGFGYVGAGSSSNYLSLGIYGTTPPLYVYPSGVGIGVGYVSNVPPANGLIVQGNVGIGTTGPDAKLDSLATTEQLRLTYTDGTVYSSFTVDSGGDLTIAPTGGDVAVTGDLAVNGATSADITSTTTTATLFNTTVTTLSLGGAATTLNLGTTDSVTRIINLGTGTGADTINIGTGATTANTIAIGTGAIANIITIGTTTASSALALNDDNWNITGAGLANFVSIGAATAGTGAFTTLTATPGSNVTALTLTGTNVTSANMAYFNSKNTSGTIFNTAYGAATSLAGALTGINLDLSTNLTATGYGVTGQSIALPAVTNTGAGTYAYKGLSVTGGALVQNTGAGTDTWTGLDITMPNITQTTGTITSTGLKITGGTVTSGTSYGLIVDSNAGNVGIGTTGPTATLQITNQGLSESTFYTGGAVTGLKLQSQTTNARSFLGIVPNGTSDLADVWLFSTSDTTTNFSSMNWGYENTSGYWGWNSIKGGTGTLHPFYFNATGNSSAATANMVLATNGNVGIGTTGPSQKLDVAGSINLTGAIAGGTTYSGSGNITSTAGVLTISGTGNSSIQGNVGIGTTSPSTKLHIVGSCVTGDTLLPIRRRRRNSNSLESDDDDNLFDYLLCRIDEILPGDEVLSLNEFTGVMEYARINALKDMDIREVYELTTKSGKVIRTTENHPYLTLLEDNPITNEGEINI